MRHTRGFTKLAALASVAGVLAGCATMKVRSFAERGADVTRYRTYAWDTTDPQSTGDPRLDNNPFFRERVQVAADREMSAHGFEKAQNGRPDLTLHIHA